MKPSFALSLSFEGIALLHRAAGGWRSVGQVAPDVPDLAAALAGLRDRALRLEPAGMTCKLIIPNDQIRYLSLDTGNAEGDARRRLVEQALDGATPYAVDELAFDISVEGQTTHIAAVARETLAEAEAFALQHDFNPVSFVAIPGDHPFLGEPFFGPCRHAASLPGGDPVEPDGIAVVVTGRAEIPEPGNAAQAPDAPDTPDIAGPDTAQPETKAEAEPVTQPAADAAAPTVGFSSRRGKIDTDSETPTDTPPALTGATRDMPPAPARPGLGAAAGAIPVTAPTIDIPGGEPPAPRPEPAAGSGRLGRRTADTPKPVAKPVDKPRSAPSFATPIADPPPADETDRMTVFGARPGQNAAGKPRHLGLILTAILLLFLAAVAAWAAIFADDGLSGLFRAAPADREFAAGPDPDAPAAAPAPAQPPLTSATPPRTPADLAALPPDTGTGGDPEPPRAAPPGTPPPPGLSDTDSAVLDALRAEPDPAAADPELEPEPDPQDSAELTAAATDPDAHPQAEALYAATGIWPTAPMQPDTPSIIGLNDLYVASIDRTDLSQDAVALPAAANLAPDLSLNAVSSPAAAGTAFRLDRRGLVTPTPEGTVTPDGVTVYLGRPKLVPPPTPARLQTTPEIDALRERLAGARPRLRPDDLVERSERAQLGGRSRSELGKKRPKPRPADLRPQAEPAEPDEPDAADDPATAQAVAVALKPRLRPSDLAPAGRPADKAAIGAAPATAAAPATVTPKIASSASVARQATLDNALNLRRVNLIGVYGTPANRRALVRLPSGRYKKVKVGDTVDGGRVIAIGDSELRYQKGGRSHILTMPNG